MADRTFHDHTCILCGSKWVDKYVIGVTCPGCRNSCWSVLDPTGHLGPVPEDYALCSMCSTKDCQILQLTNTLAVARSELETQKRYVEQFTREIFELTNLRNQEASRFEMLRTVIAERLGRDWMHSVERDAARRLQERDKAQPER